MTRPTTRNKNKRQRQGDEDDTSEIWRYYYLKFFQLVEH